MELISADQQALNVEGKRGIIPLNLQLFADGGGDGNNPGGDGGNPEGGGDGSGGGNGGCNPEGGNDNNPGGDGGGEGAEKTFTQTDVNNIAAREAKKAQEKLLKQLGIDDFDGAKEGLKKFREWQESQKSEAEKQADRIKQLESDYEKAIEQNKTYMAQVTAMKAGVAPDSVEDVVTLAKSLLSDDVDMEAAISKVVEKYPHFKGDKSGQATFSAGNHGNNPDGLSDFGRVLLGKK